MLCVRGQRLISKWVLNCSKCITNSRRRIGCVTEGLPNYRLVIMTAWQQLSGTVWVSYKQECRHCGAEVESTEVQILCYCTSEIFFQVYVLYLSLYFTANFLLFSLNFVISAKSSSKVVFHLWQNNIFTFYFYLSKGVQSMFIYFYFFTQVFRLFQNVLNVNPFSTSAVERLCILTGRVQRKAASGPTGAHSPISFFFLTWLP